MLKRLLFPCLALVALAFAATTVPADAALHCNNKVCVQIAEANEEQNQGDCMPSRRGGAGTHCIDTADGNDCGWDLCDIQ